MDASIAQLVELLICNQWVGGSSPSAGSSCRGLVNIEFASRFDFLEAVKSIGR